MKNGKTRIKDRLIIVKSAIAQKAEPVVFLSSTYKRLKFENV